jgi:hypothetical protein
MAARMSPESGTRSKTVAAASLEANLRVFM